MMKQKKFRMGFCVFFEKRTFCFFLKNPKTRFLKKTGGLFFFLKKKNVFFSTLISTHLIDKLKANQGDNKFSIPVRLTTCIIRHTAYKQKMSYSGFF